MHSQVDEVLPELQLRSRFTERRFRSWVRRPWTPQAAGPTTRAYGLDRRNVVFKSMKSPGASRAHCPIRSPRNRSMTEAVSTLMGRKGRTAPWSDLAAIWFRARWA